MGLIFEPLGDGGEDKEKRMGTTSYSTAVRNGKVWKMIKKFSRKEELTTPVT